MGKSDFKADGEGGERTLPQYADKAMFRSEDMPSQVQTWPRYLRFQGADYFPLKSQSTRAVDEPVEVVPHGEAGNQFALTAAIERERKMLEAVALWCEETAPYLPDKAAGLKHAAAKLRRLAEGGDV